MELTISGNITDDGRAFCDLAGSRRPEELRLVRLAVCARRGFHADDETRDQQFLGHDYYTDVITFDYSSQSVISGDIFISLDMIRHNAEQVGTIFVEELMRILIHGVLHLTGQGDKTPESKAQMTEKENLALAKLI